MSTYNDVKKTGKGPLWLRCLVAIDEFGNVCFYNGNPHETISQHCAWDGRQNIPQGSYCQKCWLLHATAWFLNKFFPGHLDDAISGVTRNSDYGG